MDLVDSLLPCLGLLFELGQDLGSGLSCPTRGEETDNLSGGAWMSTDKRTSIASSSSAGIDPAKSRG
jgi:hypothetical protein